MLEAKDLRQADGSWKIEIYQNAKLEDRCWKLETIWLKLKKKKNKTISAKNQQKRESLEARGYKNTVYSVILAARKISML